MKRTAILYLSLSLLLFSSVSYGQPANMAVAVDGIDNVMSIGCRIIEPPFTLELWYKPDDSEFKEREVLVGGTGLKSADIFPLTLERGVLSNPLTGLYSGEVSTPEWHHAALVCDGRSTMLYHDGNLAARKDTVISILPCDIGYQYNGKKKTLFAGQIDEFRIWSDAIPERLLRKWKGRDITPGHPFFDDLAVYFNFDSDLVDHAVNPAGTGHQPYHLRSGRIDVYNDALPIAHSVPNANPAFKSRCADRQKLFNAVVVESEWDTERGALQDQILKLRVFVSGSKHPLRIKSIRLDARDVNLKDISRLQIWDAGQSPRCREKRLLCTFDNPSRTGRVVLPGRGLELKSGVNYILLTADISPDAGLGDVVRYGIPSFRLGRRTVRPVTTDETLPKRIVRKSGPGILNVVQWNIYQGGRHVGNEGVARVTDLLRATGADLITMQEGYGSQRLISEALGMNLLTRAEDTNLALLCRYPITALPSGESFKSNPAFIDLPDGSRLYVNDLWIRYTSSPAYTENYIDPGQNTDEWIEGDRKSGLVDITAIVTDDAFPHVTEDSDLILSGDFNSGSHLDWTDPSIHHGYGHLRLPVSLYMAEQGFKDSFREVNPDETSRSEGTWAVTFGHLQHDRIDYIYYKGPRLKAIHSKIIRTAPEIDDVWASDHAAVNTVFSY